MMLVSRRELVKLVAGAGMGVALGGAVQVAHASPAPGPGSGGVRTPAAGHTIELPTGVALYYETQGRGRPLLVIHGGLGFDHSYLQPWLEPLAADRGLQLVYPDLRGNGRSSEVPDSAYTHERMVADLDALRAALGFPQWAVLGHSYGGYLAQLYALTYPETVSALVLVATSPAPLPLGSAEGVQLVADRLTPERLAVLGRLGTLGSDEELRQAWYTLLPLYVYRPQSAEQYIAHDRTIYRVRAFTRTFRLLAGFDTRAQLGRLTMPTLVAVGRYDWATPVRHSQFLYKLILGSELVIFPESGHLPFLEEPRAFLDHLARFLAA